MEKGLGTAVLFAEWKFRSGETLAQAKSLWRSFGWHRFIFAAVIYLDVTSSCKSPMNTGVQRVVRGLHRALAAATEIIPLVWDPGLTAYCRLSPREHAFLVHPFAAGRAADAEPGRRANPLPLWSKCIRRYTHRRNRLDLPAGLTAADTLFVPEIFQDNRIAWLQALPGRSAARRVGVCHDALSWRRPEINPPARRAGFAEYLDTLGTFDQIVTISRESAADLRACWRERGRPDELMPPVTIFPWPVDHDGAPRPAPVPPNREQKAKPPTVLCVGTFEPRKNHLVLLEACERLWRNGARFELVLVGRTTAQWGERVRAALERLQSAGHPVRWLKHVDDATLHQSYADCTFTVFPSLFEGFGLPILESLWHGRPCVCGRNGALGEVSAGGGCLPVDQTDPADLAAGLERLLTQPELYQRLCAEASACKFRTWKKFAEDLLPLLTGR